MKYLCAPLLILLMQTPAFAATHTFFVNMTCSSCSNAITQQIETKFKGQYSNLKLDVEKDIITLETKKLTKKQITEVIEYIGFKVMDKPIVHEPKKAKTPAQSKK